MADLILVNANPLEDVANLKGLRGVMTAGRWYDKAALQEMITPVSLFLGRSIAKGGLSTQ